MLNKWRATLRIYFDKRLLWVFLMGCCSGFPFVLIGSNLSGWLKDVGIQRATIGVLGSVAIIYAFNFIWAPLVDRVRLPLLHRLGQRRSWIFLMQLLMMVFIFGLARANPVEELHWVATLALGIAICSATQDVAVDAFRIDQFAPDETHKMPAAAAMAIIGWWTGYAWPGYLAFTHADSDGWNHVYFLMLGVMVLLTIFTLLVREPVTERATLQEEASRRYHRELHTSSSVTWLLVTLIEPFRDFFRRNGVRVALTLMLFIFLFKIGEAFLGRMSIVFYKEIGFTNAQIGEYSKMFGWFITVAFTLLGSVFNTRFGVVRGLMVGGIAMAASNLMFALIAINGPLESLFIATLIVDNFTTAFSTVAFVSFLTLLTGRAFSATQYALLASLGNLSRTTLAGLSGFTVDWLGSWERFFIVTALMVLPSLMMLWTLRHRFDALTKNAPNELKP